MSLLNKSMIKIIFPQLNSQTSKRAYSALLDGAIPQHKIKYVPKSGTYPRGFLASGTHVGVKLSNTKALDLALIISEPPCAAAAVFTKNKFQAAPVTVSRKMLERRGGEGVRAVVVNAGCANAVTGTGGIEDAHKMAAEVDKCFGDVSDSKGESTLVMSTGVIGQRLPIQKILDKIPIGYKRLSNTHDSWLSAAQAICTTDTFPKLLSRSFSLPSAPGSPPKNYHLAGMTKGAGMIHPNMATLLGILVTDAPIAAPALHPLLTHAVDRSFNSISIDGDTSTNDTVTLLANGAGEGDLIRSRLDAGYAEFEAILTDFAADLAQLVVRDGEGATKFVTIRVTGSSSYDDAKKIASTIAKSPLVKTALYGKDANWGRIICAAGYAEGVSSVVPEKTSVSFRPIDGSAVLRLLVNGEPEAFDEARAADILNHEDLEIVVDLGTGHEEAVYWTCDFSHEYITINGDYRT
ncbi:MAG: hypothetical protein M1829_001765 [Trizodia sp. TS-e1964]|nr:MAG: hypothetical protein M1829_001765 [Trizodia sp. TS-e1964]